jgi:ABC-type proline/glycine betaine transport system permease subunit
MDAELERHRTQLQSMVAERTQELHAAVAQLQDTQFAMDRVGIGVAFIVVIVAEMIAVNSGLGYRILEAREYFWSDKVIAGMITIGLCGLGIDLGMSRLNGWLLRWHRGVDG